jgi:tetratricopeptide (TPR) repeat protein
MCLAILAAGGPALGGDGGTESPFTLGAGARSLALGSADLIYCGPGVCAYWNPAVLSRTERYSLEAFHSGLYDADAGYQYFGLAVPTMDFGSFGMGVFRLGIDGIEKRDADNLYLGEISDSRLGLCLGYGSSLSGYDLGATVTIEQHSPGTYSATSSPGLTVSVARRFATGGRRLREVGIALVGRNLVGPSIKLDQQSITYPYSIEAGVSVDVLPLGTGDHRLVFAGRFAKVEDLSGWASMGIEYTLWDNVSLRGGIRDGDASFGAGLFYKYVGFNYAMVSRDLGNLHMFSINANLGMPVSERRMARERAREAEFNRLISRRLADSNREMVEGLFEEGKATAASGDLGGAVALFERALFIAQAAGIDTTEISRVANEAGARLKRQNAAEAYARNMGAARERLEADDYLGARYYVDLALSNDPGSDEAKALLDRVEDAVVESATREQTVLRGLAMADSLLDYGETGQALVLVRSLSRAAGSDGRVQRGLRKAEFSYWQRAAEDAFARADYGAARAAVDSAAARFKDHPWCITMMGKIDMEGRRRAGWAESDRGEAGRSAPAAPNLSPELEKEVAATYKRGQELFKQGDLSAAVAEWEKVDALAPGYLSVRDYLVEAYKFLGVELYTSNRLAQAVDVWKKAYKIAPDSTEISNYIKRTEHEISKLEEMSYERR